MQRPINRQGLFPNPRQCQTARFKRVSRQNMNFSAKSNRKGSKTRQSKQRPPPDSSWSRNSRYAPRMEKLSKDLTAHNFALQLYQATETQENSFASSPK